MTQKPINLNRVRKARARDAAKQQADENAATHGRSKAERQAEARKKALADKHLDGHARDDG
ncbi:amidase [Jannaschia sp. EhC01]|nr:amidase [Jannaschia sp. EhC01]